MTDKKPILKFKTNLAEKFIFVKMFKQGENDYGKFYCCEIKHDDTEKTMFASQALWDKMNKVTEGDTVEATLAEIETDDKKKHKEWQVTINGVEQSVSKTKDIADTEEAKQEYHKEKQDKDLQKSNEIRWQVALKIAGGLVDVPYTEERAKNYERWANHAFKSIPESLFNNEGGLKKDDPNLPF